MHEGDENRRNYAFERGFGSDAEEGQSLMPRPKSRRCKAAHVDAADSSASTKFVLETASSGEPSSLLGGSVPVE